MVVSLKLFTYHRIQNHDYYNYVLAPDPGCTPSHTHLYTLKLVENLNVDKMSNCKLPCPIYHLLFYYSPTLTHYRNIQESVCRAKVVSGQRF